MGLVQICTTWKKRGERRESIFQVGLAYRERSAIANSIINLILPHLNNVLSAIDDEPFAIVVVESDIRVFSVCELDEDASFCKANDHDTIRQRLGGRFVSQKASV